MRLIEDETTAGIFHRITDGGNVRRRDVCGARLYHDLFAATPECGFAQKNGRDVDHVIRCLLDWPGKSAKQSRNRTVPVAGLKIWAASLPGFMLETQFELARRFAQNDMMRTLHVRDRA